MAVTRQDAGGLLAAQRASGTLRRLHLKQENRIELDILRLLWGNAKPQPQPRYTVYVDIVPTESSYFYIGYAWSLLYFNTMSWILRSVASLSSDFSQARTLYLSTFVKVTLKSSNCPMSQSCSKMYWVFSCHQVS